MVSLQQFIIGIMSNLITIPPIFIVIFLFRKSRKTTLRENHVRQALWGNLNDKRLQTVDGNTMGEATMAPTSGMIIAEEQEIAADEPSEETSIEATDNAGETTSAKLEDEEDCEKEKEDFEIVEPGKGEAGGDEAEDEDKPEEKAENAPEGTSEEEPEKEAEENADNEEDNADDDKNGGDSGNGRIHCFCEKNVLIAVFYSYRM